MVLPTGRAQAAVAAPRPRLQADRPSGRLELELAFKKQFFYLLGSTARVFGVIAPKHACSSVAVAVSAAASWW